MKEQRKLQDEIDANWSDEYDSLYNHLNSAFNYLDLFIQETLRVFPIGNIACTRRCVVFDRSLRYSHRRRSLRLTDLCCECVALPRF